MTRRWPAVFIFVMALATMGWTGWSALTVKPVGPGVRMTPGTFAADAAVGDTVTATFMIENRTPGIVKLLGARTSCGCMSVGGVPAEITPGYRGAVTLVIKVGKPDPSGSTHQSFALLSNVPDLALLATVEIKIVPTKQGR